MQRLPITFDIAIDIRVIFEPFDMFPNNPLTFIRQ